jgi:hypothetical protein
MTENIKVSTQEYVFTHKSETKALLILRWSGTVQNVPGDGSCDYHVIMVLLCKMKLIDSSVTVTQFRREVNSFIECNMKKFVGVGDDGDDAIF